MVLSAVSSLTGDVLVFLRLLELVSGVVVVVVVTEFSISSSGRLDSY